MRATADILSDERKRIAGRMVTTREWLLSDDRIITSWDGTVIAGIDNYGWRLITRCLWASWARTWKGKWKGDVVGAYEYSMWAYSRVVSDDKTPNNSEVCGVTCLAMKILRQKMRRLPSCDCVT